MELHKTIENLLEKYFEGETSIAEENQLQDYFSSPDVAQHLEQYRSMFGFFSKAREQQFEQRLPLQPKKRRFAAWLSVAASVVVLLSVGTFAYFNQQKNAKENLGTYDNPEIAFRETQKALDLLALHVNTGVESVHYINKYEQSKNLIFKK
jgi:predicted ribosomally synthesized peptide with SipW-like signal peptide